MRANDSTHSTRSIACQVGVSRLKINYCIHILYKEHNLLPTDFLSVDASLIRVKKIWDGKVDNVLVGSFILPRRLFGDEYLSELLEVPLQISLHICYLHDGSPVKKRIGRNGLHLWPTRLLNHLLHWNTYFANIFYSKFRTIKWRMSHRTVLGQLYSLFKWSTCIKTTLRAWKLYPKKT